MMTGFDILPGNDALKASLRAALDRRFPQAVLLSGPAGSGKTALAQTLAAALLCTASGMRPCGTCASCRKMEHHMHPDCIIIDEGDNEIKVELARKIREQAAILPNDSDRKVFILSHAHRMNTSAQNALLKVLEEPPRYVFFLLTSSQPGALLQTIRSRCTIYQLEPPHTVPEQNPDLLEPIGQFLSALAHSDEYSMLIHANQLSKLSKPLFQQALSLLKTALRDAALARTRCAPLVSALSAQTRALSGTVTPQQLLALCDLCTLLSHRADRNASITIQCAVLAAGAYRICHPPDNGRESQIGGIELS